MGYYLIFLLVLIVVVILVLKFLVGWEAGIREETVLSVTKDYEDRLNNLQESQELLISQIQPHFLYNVLNTIKYLCKRNPDEALVAIDRFSDFLRKSMDAFSSKECIPFLQEMEIVKNYVYLEKCRFGDKVIVNYDIGTDEFLIPSLSIQPMVENAIKHGITKNLGGGEIWIKTYDTDTDYVIEIRDNGVGFYPEDLKKEDGKSHIGVRNTAKRIETMCHGSFSIESEPGSMTKVVMSIPKEN